MEEIRQYSFLKDEYPIGDIEQLIGILIEKELTKKGAVRRSKQFEDAPITPKNLLLVCSYYFPVFIGKYYSGNGSNFAIAGYKYAYGMKSLLRKSKDEYEEEAYIKMCDRLNDILGGYPNANMDIIEYYIKKTILHIPFAIQEFIVKPFNEKGIWEFETYVKRKRIPLLSIIWSANIDGWQSKELDLYKDLIQWLKSKIAMVDGKLHDEEAKRRVAIRVQNGGHFVSEDEIVRRYYEGFTNLNNHFVDFDNVHLFDSSAFLEQPRHLVSVQKGHVVRVTSFPGYLEKMIPDIAMASRS